MLHNPDKVNLAFWGKAIQAFKASDIALPAFCEKYLLEKDQFEKWLKVFAHNTQDEEDKRLVKESRWQFQPVRPQQDVSSPTGLAFNGCDIVCELILKNCRRLFFDSSISEAGLLKLVTVLELKKCSAK